MAQEDLMETLYKETQAGVKLGVELQHTRKLVLDIVKCVKEHRATGYNANLILAPILGAVERIMMGEFISEEMRDDHGGDETKGFTREFIEKFMENQETQEKQSEGETE